MTDLCRENERRDLHSVAAFSLLFLIPAVGSGSFLKLADETIGLGRLSFFPWALVVLSPAIASAAVAQWTCRRADTGCSTRWGFSIGAAFLAALFAVAAAAAWLLNGGD